MYEFQQAAYGQPQFQPQGLLSGLFGAPVGSAIGRGIGGLFGNPNLGGRIGEMAGGIGGALLPFGADPSAQFGGVSPQQIQQMQQLQQLQQMQQLQQQAAQQGQLTPQGGFFGGLINQFGKPAGSLIGNLTNNPTLGNVISGGLSGLGSLLPFGAEAAGQQGQQGQQAGVVQQLQQLQAYQQQLQQLLQQVQQQQAMLQQQVAQAGGQMAPQGWVSNMIGQYAQPVGSFIGGQLGNQQLGSAIGGIAGQLGRFLPFSVDPWSAYAQAQQAQLGGQQTVH